MEVGPCPKCAACGEQRHQNERQLAIGERPTPARSVVAARCLSPTITSWSPFHSLRTIVVDVVLIAVIVVTIELVCSRTCCASEPSATNLKLVIVVVVVGFPPNRGVARWLSGASRSRGDGMAT